MLCGSLSCAFVLQDVCQHQEKLKGTLLSLSAGARRLSDKEQAERTVTELNSSYDQNVQKAKDKQSTLENLLSLWQKYELFNICGIFYIVNKNNINR